MLRQNLLTDGSRRENSAEHSWHLALIATLLMEYAPVPVNIQRVITMLLIHDLVEIDAGDTFCYDPQGNQDKATREHQAADRLFSLLPLDQGTYLRQLWDEFETQETDDAQFAAALDRIQPLIQNWQTQGGTWRLHHICRDQVLHRMAPIKTGAPALWAFVQQVIDECVAEGYLQP